MDYRKKFEEIVSHDETREKFRAYLSKSFTEEHLDFRDVTSHFLLMKGKSSLTTIADIVNEFIDSESDRCINIPGHLRSEIMSAYKERNDVEVLRLFQESVGFVERMLWENFLNGFVECQEKVKKEQHYEKIELKLGKKNKRRKRSLSASQVDMKEVEVKEKKKSHKEKHHESPSSNRRKSFLGFPHRKSSSFESKEGEDVLDSKGLSPSKKHERKHRKSLLSVSHRHSEDHLHEEDPNLQNFVQREIQKAEKMVKRRNRIKLASSASDSTWDYSSDS
eukprot:TRINITY_DN1465_c0_g2_i1.p1 TRINITY_DN1465_c0_g2~~TRINITY_DN1465_c0_g2_i1.p1  ORF type:complete len:278 (-),score=71.35 TRINITY_DN1465_c0_g2_i1:73-906(-)